ncbi:hypothetical protein WOLCODRAFT_154995 [Wolfiporia cocos MD-104 SS10]|uniref:Uncharacterized protein n=1 Tax=Wolfiporia cocos (strain MD-104) TaxID=742152 RepID=A0A2H3JTT5_WOLCO|nr:hypothetical protein WOLCODRAFT_154995 [Wolfiporia cocos MD-104 SS10]
MAPAPPPPSLSSLPVSATSAVDGAFLGSSGTGMGPFLPLIVVLCVLFLVGGAAILTVCLDWYWSGSEPAVCPEAVKWPRTIDVLKYTGAGDEMWNHLGKPVAGSSCGSSSVFVNRALDSVKLSERAVTSFVIQDYNVRRPIPGLSPTLGFGGDGAMKLETPKPVAIVDRYPVWIARREKASPYADHASPELTRYNQVEATPAPALAQQTSVVAHLCQLATEKAALTIQPEGINRSTNIQLIAQPTRDHQDEKCIDAQAEAFICNVEVFAATTECAPALVVSDSPSASQDVPASPSESCPDSVSLQSCSTESELGGSDKENESLCLNNKGDLASKCSMDSMVVAPSVSFDSQLSQVIDGIEGLSIKDQSAEGRSSDSVFSALPVPFDLQLSQLIESFERLSIQDDPVSKESRNSTVGSSSTSSEDDLAEVIESFKRLSISDPPLALTTPAVAVDGCKPMSVALGLPVPKIAAAVSLAVKEAAKARNVTVSEASRKVLVNVKDAAGSSFGLDALRRIKDKGKGIAAAKRRSAPPELSVLEQFARRRKSSASKDTTTRTWRLIKLKGENAIRGKGRAPALEVPPPRLYARDIIQVLCAADASHAHLPHY